MYMKPKLSKREYGSRPQLKVVAAATAMPGLGVAPCAPAQEPMRKTPVAINTVDAKAIENQRIVAFDDLTRVAPAMTVTQKCATRRRCALKYGF